MNISVGPIPLHWGKDRVEKLCEELARSPVDYIYLGETACLHRSCFSQVFLGELCDKLTEAGKHVYASSPILVTDERQYSAFKDLAERVQGIEINSPAFLGLARRYRAIAGMFLNVYNFAAADILSRHGTERVVLPCELNFQSIASISRQCKAVTECIVHGHVPIAVSRNCRNACSLGRTDQGCDKLCGHYPDGIVLEAQGKPMFRIEGRQTLSAATYCLVEYLPQLNIAGVDTVRILPQWEHTAQIVNIYRDVLDHRKCAADAAEELRSISTTGLCNGWFSGKAGWVYESPNMEVRGAGHQALSCVQSEKQRERTFARSLCDTGAPEEFSGSLSNDEIIWRVSQLIEDISCDPEFMNQIAGVKRVSIAFIAKDTGREFTVFFDGQCVRVRPGSSESCTLKIRETEQVLWAILSGQRDADAAFFSGKVRIYGSIAKAFQVKNRFLSLLQKHLSDRLQDLEQLIEYHPLK